MKVEFTALVKSFHSKALVSGDKSYQVMLQTHEHPAIDLAQAPSDKFAKITIEWEDK